MVRILNIAVTLIAAGIFWWWIPLARLFDAFQPITVALSIMIAAVFVRLNRGMPTLEWKSLAPDGRAALTTKIVDLAAEYGWIIAVNSIALAGLVSLLVIGKEELLVLGKDRSTYWPVWTPQAFSAAVGGIGALCVARMAYVVWRDIDIVRLQKGLIDGIAARELNDQQEKRLDENVTNIRAASVRKIEVSAPKAWGE